MITWLDPGDIGPHAHHAADNFMTQHHRVSSILLVVADTMYIRVTYATVEDLDKHIVGARIATHEAMRGQGGLCKLCDVTTYRHCHRFCSMVHEVRLSPSSHASLKNNDHPEAGPSYPMRCSPLFATLLMIISYP